MCLGLAVVRDRPERADRVLEPVPARGLADQWHAGRDRLVLVELGGAPDAGGAAIEAVKERVGEVVSRLDAGNRQDRGDGIRLESLVLGGERVYRRRDYPDAIGVETVPDELLPREDVG